MVKTVWLTGSNGFIGSHLVNELSKYQFNVKCITNNINLKISKKNKLNFLQYLDFSAPEEIIACIKKFGCPNLFIHLGWGDMTSPMSKNHLSHNVQEASILIDTLFYSGLEKFIFIGSMNEYGSRVGALSEDMEPIGRITNYAKGKTLVARYGFKSASDYLKNFIHIRPFYVYGPGQRPRSLINELFEAYQNNRDAQLSDCNNYRDYVYVGDVVEGIIRSLDLTKSTTINLGSGTFIKVKKFVNIFWEKLGGDMERLKFGTKQMWKDEPDQPKSFADLSHLNEMLCWKPSYSLDKGIETTIDTLKNKCQIVN